MKNQNGPLRGRGVGLLVLAGLLAGVPAAAEPPASLRDGAWTWGYVIPGKLPGHVPFVFPDGSSCSLETAAEYLGTPNVVLMNAKWAEPGHLERLTSCRRVLCAIQVDDAAGAAKLSAMSKKYRNIVGAMIDDFYPVEAKEGILPVEVLKATYTALKSENPALKLYVVRYTTNRDDVLIPYLPYFDVVNLWSGSGTREGMWPNMEERVEKAAQVTGKPIVLGLYLHNYQAPRPDNWKTMAPWTWTKVMPMDMLQDQQLKTTDLLRKGKIEGFILLQNGWLDYETHRPQMQWTKDYLDWLFQTQTIRKPSQEKN